MGGGSGGRVTARELRRLADIARDNITESSGDGRRHVFISFVQEDLAKVNMLRGQAANSDTALDFDDFSVQEPYDSKNGDYIRSQIRARIERASVTIVYLSESAAKSKWVDWEIRESVRQGKGVIGVYSGDAPPATLPPALKEAGGRVVKWTHDGLTRAIEEASTRRG